MYISEYDRGLHNVPRICGIRDGTVDGNLIYITGKYTDERQNCLHGIRHDVQTATKGVTGND